MSNRRRVSLSVLAGAALSLPMALVGAGTAAYADTPVGNFADLQTAVTAASDTVALTANITEATANNLVVDAGDTVTLDLAGFDLTITPSTFGVPAIRVPVGATLIINDSVGGGSVTVTGGGNSAGIGGGNAQDSGAVTINSGTVTATGEGGAGIGGGFGGSGGAVTINGGTVIATGGTLSAGIGGGGSSSGGTAGDGGAVTITGGTVTAIGGTLAAGIGGGGGSTGASGGNGGAVTITGGTVTAVGFPAGIGGGLGTGDGSNGLPGTLLISGTPDGTATTGGGPVGAPITDTAPDPADLFYTATVTTVAATGGVQFDVTFHEAPDLPELADTGATVTPLLLIALGLVLAGGVALGARRVRRTN